MFVRIDEPDEDADNTDENLDVESKESSTGEDSTGDNEEELEEDNKSENEGGEFEEDNTSSYEIDNSEKIAKTDIELDGTVDTEESDTGILTAQNNDDFATLLSLKDPGDLFISEFVDKYKGETIQFDGYIAHIMNHDNYKTRYDILIYTGDGIDSPLVGPNFKFEDINIVYDLKLVGDNIPDSVGEGTKLRITAVVLEYNENQQLFFIKPISTEVR